MDYGHFEGFDDRHGRSGLHPGRLSLKKDRTALAILVFAFAASAFSMTSCGSPGAPVAPSLGLPAQVEDLAAARTGNSVQLTWTMPGRTTDRILLKHPSP